MKKTFTTGFLAFITTLIIHTSALAWGTDVLITPGAPSAQHGIAAKQNGVLYASFPFQSFTGTYTVLFYTSADNGITWTLLPVPAPSSFNPVIKTKMIVTSLDSILCFVQMDNSLYIVNVESGINGQFTQSGVQEFDAAAGTGNFCYVFIQEPGINTIRRYGTGDGGLTWTGNTALVTTTGYRPRVYMSAGRLILNYYGPVLSDTVSSVIRAAFYNEGSPGTITPGTFQDVNTNTSVKKKQFETIINNGTVWFFYTEGDLMQLLKCRVSTDNGVTYQPEFIIGGNTQVNSYKFSAAPYFSAGPNGVSVTWLSDSTAVPGSTPIFLYAVTSNISPMVFGIPAAPMDTYNDSVITTNNLTPSLINYNFSLNAEAGVAWIGESLSGSSLLFDRFSATSTAIMSHPDQNKFSIYPNPADNKIRLVLPFSVSAVNLIEILAVDGKQVHSGMASEMLNSSGELSVEMFPAGIYMIKLHTSTEIYHQKLMIVR
jgi:hypothetical protein